MPTTPLKRVTVVGLHGQQQISVDLLPGLNLIYGKNGSGKTTFLHILANLADRDLERFCHLRFERILVQNARAEQLLLTQLRTEATTKVTLEFNGQIIGSVGQGENTPPQVRAVLRECIGGSPVYLPAFRAILEAITESRARHPQYSDPERETEIRRIYDQIEAEDADLVAPPERRRQFYAMRDENYGAAYKTALCRDWFGPFVPVVRFPSLAEVAEQLALELQHAHIKVASTDREAFSDVFVKVLQSVVSGASVQEMGDIEPLLASIHDSLASLQQASGGVPPVYHHISSLMKEHSQNPTLREAIASKILRVYDQALKERTNAQREAFKRIKTFEASVNRFLQHKRLASGAADEPHRVRSRRARMIILDGGRTADLSVLSSGERHVLTLLFSATHMSTTEGMLLIDEPELSLHVDWQRVILGELMKQAGNRQIIACTHAPEVTAEHRESMTRLGTHYQQQASMFEDDGADFDA